MIEAGELRPTNDQGSRAFKQDTVHAAAVSTVSTYQVPIKIVVTKVPAKVKALQVSTGGSPHQLHAACSTAENHWASFMNSCSLSRTEASLRLRQRSTVLNGLKGVASQTSTKQPWLPSGEIQLARKKPILPEDDHEDSPACLQASHHYAALGSGVRDARPIAGVHNTSHRRLRCYCFNVKQSMALDPGADSNVYRPGTYRTSLQAHYDGAETQVCLQSLKVKKL